MFLLSLVLRFKSTRIGLEQAMKVKSTISSMAMPKLESNGIHGLVRILITMGGQMNSISVLDTMMQMMLIQMVSLTLVTNSSTLMVIQSRIG